MTTPFSGGGTNVSNRITFNTGTLNFGGTQPVQVDNITISFEGTTLPLYTIGSVVPQALVRHSLKFGMTGKVKSFPPELEAMAFGSSSIGTPNNISVYDGQPTFTNPVLTVYDLNNKEYQYQFTNAIFKSTKATFKAADYAEWDIEIDAMSIACIYTQ
jgi:hypothetical protein